MLYRVWALWRDCRQSQVSILLLSSEPGTLADGRLDGITSKTLVVSSRRSNDFAQV